MGDHGHICLNCGAEVTTAYCGHCGQKAETHRFTISHFIEHDIIHGMFHLDKGFIYTAKQLMSRPGAAIREYIDGKRVSYFNPVTLLLLMVALNLFVQHTVHYDFNNLIGNADPKASGVIAQVQAFQLKYTKQLYLLSIPLVSFSTWLIFRRTKQNYAEHLVLNTYKESGLLVVSTLFMLLSGISKDPVYFRVLTGAQGLVANIYSFLFYWQYFRPDYRKKGLLLGASILANLFLFTMLTTAFLLFIVLPMFGIVLWASPS